MRPHLRPSGILVSLAAGAAVLGVAFLGHEGKATHSGPPASSEAPVAAVPAAPAEQPAGQIEPAAPALPTEPASPNPAAAPESNAPIIPAGEAGMVVSIDPETGRPGKPSAELRARLEAVLPDPALDRSMEGIEIIHRPDGSEIADLKGRFADYTVVRITPDGRKIESCVQGPHVDEALHRHDETTPEPTSQHEVR